MRKPTNRKENEIQFISRLKIKLKKIESNNENEIECKSQIFFLQDSIQINNEQRSNAVRILRVSIFFFVSFFSCCKRMRDVIFIYLLPNTNGIATITPLSFLPCILQLRPTLTHLIIPSILMTRVMARVFSIYFIIIIISLLLLCIFCVDMVNIKFHRRDKM